VATVIHELDNERREHWRSQLQGEGDVEIIVTLLGIQKIAEQCAPPGPARVASEVVTTTIGEVLVRFVPVTFGEALDQYLAECDEDGTDLGGDDA
jgi:hypothetical protein